MARREPVSPMTATPGVVWITGEHDIGNVRELSAQLSSAAPLDNGDLVVDLSGVAFMDASTVGVLLTLRAVRAAQAARVSVRAPSATATRVLSACGLLELLEGGVMHRPAPPAVVSDDRPGDR